MPDNSHSAFGRKKTALVAALAASVLLAVVGTQFFGGYDGPLEARPAQETIGWPTRDLFGSAASGVMYRLGVPAKSSDPSPIDTRGPDGPAPTMLSTSFASKSSFEEIEDHYQNSCVEIGLKVVPPENAPSWIPEIYCSGRYEGQPIGVSIGTDCKNGLCEVFLEVFG